MNLIQIKQVQNLDSTFGSLSGALNNTGHVLIDFLSGLSVFSGQKTFTGEAIFNSGITVKGPVDARDGTFSSLTTSPYLFPALFEPHTGLHISGQDLLIEPSYWPIQGGNLYVRGAAAISGDLTILDQDGEPTVLIQEFVRDGGILYQTGLSELNIGFAEAIGGPYANKTFNVSGGAQVLGDFTASGDVLISGATVDVPHGAISGNELRSPNIYTTGAGGAWEKLSGWTQVAEALSHPEGPQGAIQFKSGTNFSGNEAYICDTGTDKLLVSGLTSSGLISGATDLIIDGSITGGSFYSTAPGTKYLSGNSNVEVISDAVLSLSGNSRTEMHNAVPYYNVEAVATTPHTYDTTLAIEGYRTDITSFTISIPTPASTESGQQIILKDIGGNAAVNNIEVTGAGITTIDGTTGTFLTKDYASLALFSDGVNWFSLYSGMGL
tara:strand:- start:81 stop:1394 length:1314 start_codon:yes stop_codon:yes gene_type:complete